MYEELKKQQWWKDLSPEVREDLEKAMHVTEVFEANGIRVPTLEEDMTTMQRMSEALGFDSHDMKEYSTNKE